jgi:hypothetical protein
MPRRINTVRVKANRNYTVEEAAEAVDGTPQTVRSWLKKGLPAMSSQRPTLIMGWALKEYLARSAQKRRRPLLAGEFFCLACKSPRGPALGMTDYHALSTKHGLLRALCEVCEGSCTRIVSASSLPAWQAIGPMNCTSGAKA